jgi:hypothetical protein
MAGRQAKTITPAQLDLLMQHKSEEMVGERF